MPRTRPPTDHPSHSTGPFDCCAAQVGVWRRRRRTAPQTGCDLECASKSDSKDCYKKCDNRKDKCRRVCRKTMDCGWFGSTDKDKCEGCKQCCDDTCDNAGCGWMLTSGKPYSCTDDRGPGHYTSKSDERNGLGTCQLEEHRGAKDPCRVPLTYPWQNKYATCDPDAVLVDDAGQNCYYKSKFFCKYQNPTTKAEYNNWCPAVTADSAGCNDDKYCNTVVLATRRRRRARL